MSSLRTVAPLALSSLLCLGVRQGSTQSGGWLTTRVPSTGTANGANPMGELTLGAAANLYGTTVMCGSGYYGTVFEIVNTGTVSRPVYTGGVIMLVNFRAPNPQPK